MNNSDENLDSLISKLRSFNEDIKKISYIDDPLVIGLDELTNDIIEHLETNETKEETNDEIIKLKNKNQALLEILQEADSTINKITDELFESEKCCKRLKIDKLTMKKTIEDFEIDINDKNITIAKLHKIINMYNINIDDESCDNSGRKNEKSLKHVENKLNLKEKEQLIHLQNENKKYEKIFAKFQIDMKNLEDRNNDLEHDIIHTVIKINAPRNNPNSENIDLPIENMNTLNTSIHDEINLINQNEELIMMRDDYRNLIIANRKLLLENMNLREGSCFNKCKCPKFKRCMIS